MYSEPIPGTGLTDGDELKPDKKETKQMKKKSNKDDSITAEIGRVWLTMEKRNGKYMVGFQTNLVNSDLGNLVNFTRDTLDIDLEPDRMFNDFTGETYTIVGKKVHDAIRKWIANNTDWQFVRKVDDSDLIEEREEQE